MLQLHLLIHRIKFNILQLQIWYQLNPFPSHQIQELLRIEDICQETKISHSFELREVRKKQQCKYEDGKYNHTQFIFEEQHSENTETQRDVHKMHQKFFKYLETLKAIQINQIKDVAKKSEVIQLERKKYKDTVIQTIWSDPLCL